MTWLYAVGTDYPELRWGRCAGKMRMEPGYHSRAERKLGTKQGVVRISPRARLATPAVFRVTLHANARSARKAGR